MTPTLTTERLTLRPYALGDFPAYAAFLATPRARFMGGPLDAEGAWAYFTNDVAQWALAGIGGLLVAPRSGGAPVGQVALCHGLFPEPELGWFLFDGHEGRGYATEAAAGLLHWARDTGAVASLVSYIDAENHASRRLAERLGATLDPAAATPGGSPTLVYRHRSAA